MSTPPSHTDGFIFSRQILLDSPTTHPALNYLTIGRAFATIISQSEPRFAIGIFGKWGSGKTTLMKAIQAALEDDSIVIVNFNAWRFEREPQLLVPLLDSIRAELVQWSEARDQPTREKVRSVANRIGRVVRALAKGLSAEVGMPGAMTIGYDVGTALDALSPPEAAQSLYVAAFQELERAFGEFAEGGVTRVVVFVDDLDRCLPSNALDVLESMKLFFDLPGFVFVVGLDEDVVERAIRAKFAAQDEPGARDATRSVASVELPSQRLAREYIKKIFQVPYSLPPMVPEQLDDLLQSMYNEATLHPSQLDDLQNRVRPYLEYVAIERRVNPREVKRFINAYTLQTLIRPELYPETVLAVQTLTFRYEWNLLYDAIFSDSAAFIEALRRYRQGDDGAFKDLLPELETLPTSLADFLRSPQAETLLRHRSLEDYLVSLRETRADRLNRGWVNADDEPVFEAYLTVDKLYQAIRAPDNREDQDSWLSRINDLARRLSRSSHNYPIGIQAMLHELDRKLRNFINRVQEVDDAETIDRLADGVAVEVGKARSELLQFIKPV